MDLRRTSQPLAQDDRLAVLPLARAKAQARISHSFEDSLITAYILAAYDHFAGPDGWLNGCALLEEEFDLFLPSRGSIERQPCGWATELPMRPFVSLTSFGCLQADGSYADVPAAEFSVLRDGIGFARIVKTASAPWSVTPVASAEAYRIRFRAGFGTAADVPEPLKQAMALLVAEFYDNRSAAADMVRSEVAYGVRRLAGPYRMAKDHS